jgi:hypothetical protein
MDVFPTAFPSLSPLLPQVLHTGAPGEPAETRLERAEQAHNAQARASTAALRADAASASAPRRSSRWRTPKLSQRRPPRLTRRLARS